MRLSIAFALMLSAPFAAADPVTVYDDAYGPADCATPGDYHYGETSVTVEQGDLYARAGGNNFCYNDFENGQYSSNSVFAQVGTPAGWAYVAWSGTPERSCYLFAAVGGQFAYQPCPAALGPPDPGWGGLLP